MKPKLVLVDWEDSNVHGGWNSIEHYADCQPSKCRTVGWVAKKDRHSITVVQSLSANEVSDGMTIPRGCVKSIKYLEE